MKLIEIVKYNFGLTTKEAKAYIKTINKQARENLINEFEQNAKKCFYED